jgi:hypothetical protein
MRSQHPGHNSVGRDHEIFDQLGGGIFFLMDHVDDLIIQHERTHFVGLQAECSLLEALLLQLLCNFILKFKLCLQVI